MPDDSRILEAVQKIAEALGVPAEEVDWVTDELLDMPATPTEEGDVEAEILEEDDKGVTAAVVPNRITLVSHVTPGFTGSGTNYQYYANCTYETRWLIWGTSVNRFERDGWCRTPNGSYVPRYKMYWRA